jgi:septal ring factor EnvC (AmiA/AmiB activator)
MFFCDQCSKIHEKKDPSHFISLHVVKSNKVCHKHKDRLACYSCKKCDVLICEDCIKKHKSHDIRKDLLQNKKHNNDKQHLLQIKKQQLKQIDNLISQLMNAFEAVQCEIQQIEKEINKK